MATTRITSSATPRHHESDVVPFADHGQCYQALAGSLVDMLLCLNQRQGSTIVVKYGGQARKDPLLAAAFAQDLVLLKQAGIHPIIVHDGADDMSSAMQSIGAVLREDVHYGHASNDHMTVQIAEMCVSGWLNKSIVNAIHTAGGLAVGLSGKDGVLIEARRLRCTKTLSRGNVEQIVNLGYIGSPTAVNPEILVALEETDFIPVVAPFGVGEQGETYLLHPNTVAETLAIAVGAASLVLMYDGPGIVDPRDADHRVIRELLLHDARALMPHIPRYDHETMRHLESCIEAVTNQIEQVYLIDGRIPHALLLQLLTLDPQIGTVVRQLVRP